MNKILGIGIVLAVIVAVGGYFYPKFSPSLGASAGSTFLSAKFAGIVANLANPGANATSSSILNTDAGNRYVTGFRYGCSNVGTSKTAYTGAGLANLQITVGTTSTAAPAAIPSQAFLIANALNISTTSVNTASGSSTPTVALGNATIWPTGSYMTFWVNATNTAVCTFGVDYIGS